MSLVFITVRQGINVGIVEQRMIPVAPREPLGANPQIFIFHERGPLVRLIFVRQITINPAQNNRREAHEESQVFPQLITP